MDAPNFVEGKVGTPELLAEAAEREFLGRTFAGRHPFAAFVVAPIPTTVLLITAMILFWVAIGGLINLAIGSSSVPSGNSSVTAFERTLIYGYVYFWRTVPFLVSAWLFIRLSCRTGQPIWGLVACVIVACFAVFFCTSVGPIPGQQNFAWVIGFGFPFRPDQWLQAALPLALGLWTWWRMPGARANATGPRAGQSSNVPVQA